MSIPSTRVAPAQDAIPAMNRRRASEIVGS